MISKKGWIELPAEGTSMYPLIKEGNLCRFVPCETLLFKKGDIVLFQASAGELVTHRFMKSETINGQTMYFFKGDTNLALDEPVYAENIIGRLTVVNKRTVSIKTAGIASMGWSKIICSSPVLSGLLRSYLNKKKSGLQ